MKLKSFQKTANFPAGKAFGKSREKNGKHPLKIA